MQVTHLLKFSPDLGALRLVGEMEVRKEDIESQGSTHKLFFPWRLCSREWRKIVQGHVLAYETQGGKTSSRHHVFTGH